MSCQVLMHPSELLMIRLSPLWIPFSIQPNHNISVGLAIDEVDIRQLCVRITIHIHRKLSMSEMRKSHPPILQSHVQLYLSFPVPPHWSLHPKLRPLPSTMSQHKANDNTRQRMEESEIDSSSLFKSSIVRYLFRPIFPMLLWLLTMFSTFLPSLYTAFETPCI
ncbi:hypothetical protein TNCV_2538921 [Trichonephila clavipes]|nr:hypothetical protein TNCV_2538921 [Trichonephila clavipes]